MEPVHSDTATRDHLANERTFLAWTRTALGCAALGLLIDRVGVGNAHPARSWLSGGVLVLAGVFFQLVGLWRYIGLHRRIYSAPGHGSVLWAVVVTGVMVGATLAIAAFLHLV